MSSIEYQIEERLSEGCRILANDGQGDMIWGHVSARRSHSDQSIFMKPAGFGLDEINKHNLIVVNDAGEKISGLAPVHVEVFIHTEILKHRKDVNAVVHTHPINSVVFSSLDIPLLPIGHEGAMFCSGLPVFKETSDLIVTAELGSKVCDVLGDCNALILQNHGIVTVGRTVEEAVMTAIMLEKACKSQLLALASGEIKAFSSQEDTSAKKKRIYNEKSLKLAFDYCARKISHSGCSCGAHK